MGKPPPSDAQLEQRVAELEARMDTAEANILTLDENLALLDGTVDALDARVAALEAAATAPAPEPPPGIDNTLPKPPGGVIDNTLPTPEPPPVTGDRTPLTATVTYNGTATVFNEADGKDLGNYVDPAGAFTQRCIEMRSLTIRDFLVHFRPDLDGKREEVVFELGSAKQGNAPYTMLEYTVVIKAGDTTLYEAVIKNQFYRSRWRWQSTPRPVRVEVADLIADGRLPNYTEQLATNTGPSSVHTYAPMGFAGLTKVMGSTGDREDIGPLTECQADYVCTGRNLSTVLAQAEASGSFPWHYRDAETNATLDGYVKLQASSYNSSSPNPYLPGEWSLDPNNPAAIDKVQCDTAHHPNVVYLPALLTGDPYYIEELQNIVGFTFHGQPWNGRWYDIYFAIRAHAWAARSTACCEIITPEAVPSWLLPKAWFTRYLNDNRQWLMDTRVGTGARSGKSTYEIAPEALEAYGLSAEARAAEDKSVAWRRFSTTEASFGDNNEAPAAPQGTYSQTYMEEFEAFIFCWIVQMGHEDWRPVAEWKLKNTIARTDGTSGWCRAISTPYRQIMRPAADQPWCADWKASWDLTAQRYNFAPADPDTITVSGGDISYYTYSEAALAMAKGLGIAGAAECHAWIHGQVNNLISTGGRARARRWCVAG